LPPLLVSLLANPNRDCTSLKDKAMIHSSLFL
jgi:hypothetical protein